MLKQSRLEADPNAYMAAQNQANWSWGARIYIQMMMLAQEQGILTTGWHLLGRLHTIEREFNRSAKSEELWNAGKGSIGFSDYTLEEAKAISSDDWQLIAISYVTQRDMRAYLDMWGFSFENKAKQQVGSLSLTAMPLKYFASENTGYCLDDFAKYPLDVDVSAVWPL